MSVEYLETGDGRSLAHCRTSGAQPGVVFLGGFSSDMDGTKALYLEDWAKRRGRAFLRFDYSGHGRSSGSFEEGCISDWATDAFDVISSLAEGPQVLVGSSMGGWISLLVAPRLKGKVTGLVGIAAAPDFTEDFRLSSPIRDQWHVLERDGRLELESDYSDEPMVITKKLIDDGCHNLVLERPMHLPFPVRFLQGTDDTDVDQKVALKLLAHASGPDIRLVLVKGADHRFSSRECLELIEQSVESVLASSKVSC